MLQIDSRIRVKLACKSENNDNMFMSMLFFVIVIFGRKEKKALSVTIVSCVFFFGTAIRLHVFLVLVNSIEQKL